MVVEPQDCFFCRGTGWDSAARRMGMENMHPMHTPIGTWPCAQCRGTGKLIPWGERFGELLDEALKDYKEFVKKGGKHGTG